MAEPLDPERSIALDAADDVGPAVRLLGVLTRLVGDARVRHPLLASRELLPVTLGHVLRSELCTWDLQRKVGAEEGNGLRPGITCQLVVGVGLVQTGIGHEAMPETRIDDLVVVETPCPECVAEEGHVGHVDELVLVAPEADDGPVHLGRSGLQGRHDVRDRRAGWRAEAPVERDRCEVVALARQVHHERSAEAEANRADLVTGHCAVGGQEVDCCAEVLDGPLLVPLPHPGACVIRGLFLERPVAKEGLGQQSYAARLCEPSGDELVERRPAEEVGDDQHAWTGAGLGEGHEGGHVVAARNGYQDLLRRHDRDLGAFRNLGMAHGLVLSLGSDLYDSCVRRNWWAARRLPLRASDPIPNAPV